MRYGQVAAVGNDTFKGQTLAVVRQEGRRSRARGAQAKLTRASVGQCDPSVHPESF